MKQLFIIGSTVLALTGCAQIMQKPQEVAPVQPGDGQTRPQSRPAGGAAVKPPSGARTVEQFDTTSQAEKAAAAEAAQQAVKSGAGQKLGQTVASLGDPAKPGLWIETPLVSKASKGRVVYPVNGKAVELDLIPIEGPKTAGSRMSLAALRVIEAPLTDLPTVEVYSE
ncbi:hypothetical protein [Rhodalgimonas zhirmunskyi]|uniref:D-galactarate dehydratase n=1 Tax=Rhodalgimonas zhirmunskyi TaxID=2964767 RepID=A0AAJ1UBF1_9RHOB|nr:hypothetical protein [Rhodoalgimonas zhirmunskyi]MDQ2095400.1 hypothetical protein [Rhodoalgimonas zhirmunskyi]